MEERATQQSTQETHWPAAVSGDTDLLHLSACSTISRTPGAEPHLDHRQAQTSRPNLSLMEQPDSP